jgi:hypothetical protein
MVKLPDANSLGYRLPGASRGQPRYPSDSPLAASLKGLGNTISNIAESQLLEQRQRADQEARYGAEDQLIKFRLSQQQAMVQSQQGAQPGAPGFTDNF